MIDTAPVKLHIAQLHERNVFAAYLMTTHDDDVCAREVCTLSRDMVDAYPEWRRWLETILLLCVCRDSGYPPGALTLERNGDDTVVRMVAQ